MILLVVSPGVLSTSDPRRPAPLAISTANSSAKLVKLWLTWSGGPAKSHLRLGLLTTPAKFYELGFKLKGRICERRGSGAFGTPQTRPMKRQEA